MDYLDPITAILWVTWAKVILGLVVTGIIATSIYRFHGLILTTMGLLLLSNVVTLIIIAGMTGH